MQNKPLLLRFTVLVVFSLVGLAIGGRPINDPDMGWHLAGGLFMLETGNVPLVDPFGVLHRDWIAYSWLIEILFALVHRVDGFFALRWLQMASVVLLVWSLWYLVVSVSNYERGNELCDETCSQRILHSEFVSFVVGLGLVLPVAYLRPQLVSLVLFAVLLCWAECKKLSPIRVVPLTILWANVHVYWVIAPVVAFLYAISTPADSLWFRVVRAIAIGVGCGVLGIISPYGFRNIQVVWEYAFFHQEGFALVGEFQSIATGGWFLFVWFVGAVCLLLFQSKKAWQRCGVPLLLLCAGTGVAGAISIKFIPLFGISVSAALVKTMLSRVEACNHLLKGRDAYSSKRSKFLWIGAAGAFAMLIVLIVCDLSSAYGKPVSAKYQELLELVAMLPPPAVDSLDRDVTVLTHFDNGGWVALGFLYRGNLHQGKQNRFLTTIDGRTLVAGSERLSEFSKLNSLDNGWCEIIKKWQPYAAILPISMQLVNKIDSCESFREMKIGKYWVVLIKNQEIPRV